MIRLLTSTVILSFSLTTIVFADGEIMTFPSKSELFLISTGGLIAIESTMLLIGMNLPEPSSWSNAKNITLAISDVLLGGALIFLSTIPESERYGTPFYLVTSLLCVTHIYRDVELFPYFGTEPFTANIALSILNNVRLGLVFGSIGISVAAHLKT